MRQILFYVDMKNPFAFWEPDVVNGLPHVGITLLLVAAASIWFTTILVQRRGGVEADR